jgi:hypothetical protein
VTILLDVEVAVPAVEASLLVNRNVNESLILCFKGQGLEMAPVFFYFI